jgi:NAD(P)-dependent dehydrogenase (short-subunit alcohol dehydrogenase family)
MGVLDGRVACVTGGTRGIGLAIAKAFLDEGAKVVINGRDAAKGQRSIDELNAGDRVHFIAGDVKVRADCEAIVQGTVDHFGAIDILVPNAGGGSDYAPVAQMTDEAMADAMTWNFWHTFWTMRAALNHMIPRQWGRIINMSSVEGKVGKPAISSYVAAKHAINGLTKSAAKEVGTLGITVNAVCPGAIETDIMIAQGPGAAEAMGLTYEGLLGMFAQESAVKRLNEPEDVAMVAVLLASDAGAGITGSMISIDGGTSPY